MCILPASAFSPVLAFTALDETWQRFLPATWFGKGLEGAVAAVTSAARAGFTGGYLSALHLQISVWNLSVCICLILLCHTEVGVSSSTLWEKRAASSQYRAGIAIGMCSPHCRVVFRCDWPRSKVCRTERKEGWFSSCLFHSL